MKGIITWFVDNHVAANLLMTIMIVGGLLSFLTVRQEEFPEIDPDIVQVQVPYLGASPEEVERAVCVRIEEALESIQGIEDLNVGASEGFCLVMAEVETGYDSGLVANDIKSQVDGINTFPVETEKPIVSSFKFRSGAMQIMLAGDVSERALKEMGRDLRDRIAALSGISQVDLGFTRDYEISVEVSEQAMRRHGLTLAEVGSAVARTSVDMPGGSIRTESGEILLRTEGQAYTGAELEDVVVLTRADGTRLQLFEIANIVDGFAEGDLLARLDGKPAVMISVYRVGDEDVLEIAEAVLEFLPEFRDTLPPGMDLIVWQSESEELSARLSVLSRNALGGLALVVIILSLFLRFRVAMWVAAGIPIAVLGGVMIFPFTTVTISSLTVMAFILVLGIVVDDAIVVGERVHAHEQMGKSRRQAAIDGTYEVSVPVIFGVLTTMATFLPLMANTSAMGDFFAPIAYVVIMCLIMSLVESQLILPVHLYHRKSSDPDKPESAFVQGWKRFQGRLADSLQDFANRRYRAGVERAVRYRYVTGASALAAVIVVIGLVASDRVIFQFMPAVEGDRIYATLTMPEGVPIEMTAAAVQQLERAALELEAELLAERPTGAPNLVDRVFTSVGKQIERGGGPPRPTFAGQSHFGEVAISMPPFDVRGDVSITAISDRWRELTGNIPDAVQLTFSAEAFSAGESIYFRLIGRDVDQLREMAAEMRGELARYEGVYDISDSFRAGKQEIRLSLKPAARTLGLTMNDLASQVRQAFYGLEVQRVQRGQDDVRLMVRYPENERRSIGNLEDMRIRTADGTEVPFSAVADVTLSRGYSSINRENGQRVISVTGEVDRNVILPEEVVPAIMRNVVPELQERYPGVEVTLGGEQEERTKALLGLFVAGLLALLVIYALLAIPLKSYMQPFVIMSVIPFGAMGAIAGHFIMDYALVFFSMLGMVALSGVVVNASLVMVDYANRLRREGLDAQEAIVRAGMTRFRPIVLTSATTFIGLIPLLSSRNWATEFVIPMAISLGFGVLFATAITLFLVPALYLVLEDLLLLSGSRKEDDFTRNVAVAPT